MHRSGGVTTAAAMAMAVAMLAVTGCGDDSESGPAPCEQEAGAGCSVRSGDIDWNHGHSETLAWLLERFAMTQRESEIRFGLFSLSDPRICRIWREVPSNSST